jgi:Oxidoreductase molybdopterin binding domain
MKSVRATLIMLPLAAGLALAATGSAAALGSAGGAVRIDGDVAHRLTISFARLAALPQVTVHVSYQSPAGTTTHTERGPLLASVIALAGPRFSSATQNDSLRFYVEATASDGYGALVAYDEVRPLIGRSRVILSLDQDGRSLETVGPRLIVPGDAGGERNVDYVIRLTVGHG